jgi:hypothetical protein
MGWFQFYDRKRVYDNQIGNGPGSNGTFFGHMWVADGYLRAVYCSGQTLLKLHMNWGWGGQGNGLFNYDNFSITVNGTTHSFNNNKLMVFNIIP